MLVGETGCRQIGGTANESILVPYGACGKVVIGVYRCPVYGAYICFFCGDAAGCVRRGRTGTYTLVPGV